MWTLDLQEGQTFSSVSLARFKLLQAIARGEKITNIKTPEAEYLMSKHATIQAFLGVHPQLHLFFAVPMTQQSLKEIEPLVAKQEQRLAKQEEFEERRLASQSRYFHGGNK